MVPGGGDRVDTGAAEVDDAVLSIPQQEPENPAPTLVRTAGGDDAAATHQEDSATSAEGSDDSSQATVALVVAVLALRVGLAGGALGLRAARRTVSP